MPRADATLRTARANAASSGGPSISTTNSRSSFTKSTVTCFRSRSEVALPKSSSARRTPASRSAARVPASGSASMPTPPVSSSTSDDGGSPDARTAASSASSAPATASCPGETLTLTKTGRSVGRGHPPAARQASSRTYAPIGPINPDLSASGRKSPGARVPRRGWRQRISASAPATAPLPSRTTGWYSSRNSPRSRARLSSSSSSSSLGRAFRCRVAMERLRPLGAPAHGGRRRPDKG
jgi:hypothetical protein